MTEAETIKCIAILRASYPSAPMDENTVRVWTSMLSDLEFTDCEQAVKQIICTSKWFPTIAEIRAQVTETKLQHLPAVEVAWGEVIKAISRYGMNRTPKFSCFEIEAAVDAIGWRSICLDENVMSTRARWIDAYRSIRESTVTKSQQGIHAPKRESIPARTGVLHRLEFKKD